MSVFVITADQTTTQIIAFEDTLFLTQGVSIAVAFGDGIETNAFTDDGTRLQINGSVFGSLLGIDLFSTFSGNVSTGKGNHRVNVGATGSVTGGIGDGIGLLGTGNVVVNHGGINALVDDSAGIRQVGDDASIKNFGSIDGYYGILLTGDGGGSEIINTGVISGWEAAISVSGQSVTVVNAGLIDGRVELSDLADSFDGRGGMLLGLVAGGDGDDVYFTDDSALRIIEKANEGTDVVKSTVNYELGDFLETLKLVGADDLIGTGNDLDNVVGGNAGDNDLRGGAGLDTLSGNGGDDILRGGRDDDTLKGGAGDDLLRGGLNSDELKGGVGNDVLIGGAGKDTLFGQSGDDVFRFNKAAHSPDGGTSDRIIDFVAGEDIIDLRALVPGNLDFIGTANFGGTGPGEVRLSVVGNDTRVKVDVDGDGTSDMRIVVVGVTNLSETDFLL